MCSLLHEAIGCVLGGAHDLEPAEGHHSLGLNKLKGSSSEGVLSDLGGGGLLGTAGGLLLGLEGGELSAEGTILLLAEVDGRVSLLLELVASALDALLGEDGEHLGDVLSHRSDLGELDLLLGDLGDAEGGELLAVLRELLDQLGFLVLSKRMGSDLVHYLCVFGC